MKIFRLLVIGIYHLVPIFVLVRLILLRNEGGWGLILLLMLISLCITLNIELDR